MTNRRKKEFKKEEELDGWGKGAKVGITESKGWGKVIRKRK